MATSKVKGQGRMFERMTDRARRAIVLAQAEARLFHHNYIGTEHLLLGLIHEGNGVAAKALESLGISLEAVRSEVDEIVGQGQHVPSGHLPFTPRAKKVLEHSLREALDLRHDYVGPEHILLGVTRNPDGAAAQILVNLCGGIDPVRDAVMAVFAAGQDAVGLGSDEVWESSDDQISFAARRAAAAILALPAPQRPEALFRAYRFVVRAVEDERGNEKGTVGS